MGSKSQGKNAKGEGDILLLSLVEIALGSCIFFILRVANSGSFPKPLSSKEERRQLELLRDGSKAARAKLIEHNLRLVAHVIKKYYLKTNDQDDLVSIGTIGLIRAIDTFNISKGIKLSSYAARCIENEILMFFRNSKKTAQDVSINEPIDTDKEGNALTLMEIVSTDDDIFDNLDAKFRAEKLYRYIQKNLNPREKIIVELRYGLHGKPSLTQREVAKRLKISRSYVSRIEKKALHSLRKCF
ncbi:MAG: RNA polymerase sporulation sigma factor SigK [Oscillospiraceae bacterium]|jgi:RNA polymerase sporulation-specific sigma factor|nr:RNA polymerase sporulation sigma factor SigK [Oscillospiraceae bacterium]